MPIYVYKDTAGHVFEISKPVAQADMPEYCPYCRADMFRVPVPFQFRMKDV